MLKALFWLLFSLATVQASAKVSFDQRTESIRKIDEITSLYKSTSDLSQSPANALKPLLKPNQAALDQLLSDFQASTSFVRGEIENEKTLNRLMACLQLSMLQARSDSFDGKWPDVEKIFSSWFLFAADFPYEESSLVGLRTAGVIRSLLLDDLEKIQKKFSSSVAQDGRLRKWFLQVRAPWPVDRVFVSEAKRLLPAPMTSVAFSAAKAFQKNPYQSAEKALQHVRGGQSQAAELLKQIWRDSDIDLMKTEVNRIGKLKLRLAEAEYEWQKKKPAQSVQELINAHLLDQGPIDYFSGKPLDLTSL